MGDVVEQRPDGTPGASGAVPPGGEPEIAPDAAPAPPGTDLTPTGATPPPDLDAEQLRRFREFQEFQQYQEFVRYQQAHGGAVSRTTGADVVPAPPAAPGRRLPGWLRWLGKKVLGWLVFFLLLAIFATWLFNELFGADDDNSTEAAANMGGGQYHTEELLAKEPFEAVRKVYDAIAQEDPATNRPLVSEACGHFDNDNGIQQRFAENTGGHADCRQAVIALHAQVTHVNDYAESIFPRWYDPSAPTVRIDSCDFAVQGGPALGVFVVSEVEMGQWLITGHEPGPATCGASVSATSGGDN
ncbi:hypothetical protein [Saccharomonospora piscinae]|uniref:hypothetical protein n=1 Tax=Saccharomonospora piscinae TaxID=687388 RepID=UPI0004649509|nr:hypothetical protein [Saccharomonospora piscinae]